MNIRIENLGFDTSIGNISAFATYGNLVRNLSWHNCRFTGFGSGTMAISLSGITHTLIENCEFRGAADGRGTAIAIGAGSTGLRIRGSKFLYCNSGIIGDTGTGVGVDEVLIEDCVIDGCYFDLLWWGLKTRASNSGGTVTYSPTVLTDSAGTFLSLGLAQWDTVRVMPVRRARNLISCRWN